MCQKTLVFVIQEIEIKKSFCYFVVQDYYSIILYETMDISRIEQLSFCIRYCTNELKVHKKFLRLKKIGPYPVTGYCKETDTVYKFQGFFIL